MQKVKSWPDFFLYIARVLVFLILIAVLLPKVITMCSFWISSKTHDETKPSGNPMRVEEMAPDWSRFVIQLLPDKQ